MELKAAGLLNRQVDSTNLEDKDVKNIVNDFPLARVSVVIQYRENVGFTWLRLPAELAKLADARKLELVCGDQMSSKWRWSWLGD